jgi:hypothetical protein
MLAPKNIHNMAANNSTDFTADRSDQKTILSLLLFLQCTSSISDEGTGMAISFFVTQLLIGILNKSHGRKARGGLGLPKVLPGPAKPHPSTP